MEQVRIMTHPSANLVEYININILYFHHLDHCDCGTACTMPDGWPGFCNMEQTCIHSFMPPDCGPGTNTNNRYIFLSKNNVRGNILIAHIYLLFSIGHDTDAPPEKTTTEYYGKIAYIFVWKIAEFIL